MWRGREREKERERESNRTVTMREVIGGREDTVNKLRENFISTIILNMCERLR